MHFAIKSSVLLYLLINLLSHLTVTAADTTIDLCGDTNGMDFTAFKTLSWNWTQTNKDESIDYRINFCSPLTTLTDKSIPIECNNSLICQHFRSDNHSAGFKLSRADVKLSENDTKKKEVWAQFDGPVKCDSSSLHLLNKSVEIHFICGPQVGEPKLFVTTKCKTVFNWTTPAVCDKPLTTVPPPLTTSPPKIVHCVWENGSHIVDLKQMSMMSGNLFTVGIPSSSSDEFFIYYINICRPLNPIKEDHISLEGCGANSAACKIDITGIRHHLNLGEATDPPISGFDGSINLFYKNGDICPTNPNKRISTRIRFECDPTAGQVNPTVHEPGSESMDSEECVYMFEIRTAAVCDVIQPTKLEINSCRFTNQLTGLSVDLSSLKKPSKEPYNITTESGNTYELNVCGLVNSIASPDCYKSAVCKISNNNSQPAVNYGLLTDSSFFYNGKEQLTLKHFNGSKCTGNSDNGKMSSEINFICNTNAKDTKPKLTSESSCLVAFDWETDLVCNLRLPKCSFVGNDKYYNLRQLSSISHSWNATDPKEPSATYLINVCTKLPTTVGCDDPNAAVCKCTQDSNNQLNCSHSLGDPSYDELEVLGDGHLKLTYRNGDSQDCTPGFKAQTHIEFKCSTRTGKPVFKEFVKEKCIYKFEWLTFMACSVTDRNDTLSLENGFLRDERIGAYIDIKPLLSKTFHVNESREIANNKVDNYTYVINLNKTQLSDISRCSEAAVCQTKSDVFYRDIGSLASIQYYLRGHELQIILQSLGAKKCGRNKNKNVTTIFRLHCSSSAGIGEPTFMYESNDCDYTFNWETSLVCADQFIDSVEFDTNHDHKSEINVDPSESQNDSSTARSTTSNVWIGILIIMFFLVTVTGLVFYKQRVRQSLMFKFRQIFKPETTTNHTFHYHQLASLDKNRQTSDVVFTDNNDDPNIQNRNTIAAQSSTHVPYYTIYDDSDVDLLT